MVKSRFEFIRFIIISTAVLITQDIQSSDFGDYRQTQTGDDGQSSKQYSITFSRLIFRPSGQFDIAIAPEEFRISLIEEMRSRRFNVLGVENILFGKDKSEYARMLLGGTIQHLKCRTNRTHTKGKCSIAVIWELFDRKKDEVVYKERTIFKQIVSTREEEISNSAHQLVLGAFRILIGNRDFRRALAVKDEVRQHIEYNSADYRKCNIKRLRLPKAMPKVMNATVVVRSGNAVGSGFFISKDGLIVTANHVVEGKDQVEIKTHKGNTLSAAVVRRDPVHDVALLHADLQIDACLPLANREPNPGEKVYSIGTPAGEELSFSVSQGIISGMRTWKEHRFIQTDAVINPGHSGGPLVDKRGRVLGVISWKIAMAGYEGLGFGVPMTMALDCLALKPSKHTSSTLRREDTTQVSPTTAGELASSSNQCKPSCRPGFLCHKGRCVSPCNPTCQFDEICTRSGKCIPVSPASAR